MPNLILVNIYGFQREKAISLADKIKKIQWSGKIEIRVSIFPIDVWDENGNPRSFIEIMFPLATFPNTLSDNFFIDIFERNGIKEELLVFYKLHFIRAYEKVPEALESKSPIF